MCDMTIYDFDIVGNAKVFLTITSLLTSRIREKEVGNPAISRSHSDVYPIFSTTLTVQMVRE